MTIDELMALPVFQPFTNISVRIRPDGTAIAPNGTILHGLRGAYVNFPHANARAAFWVDDDTPLTWRDTDGQQWQLVGTPTGLAREPIRTYTNQGGGIE